MDYSSSRQSASASKIATIDVSQLDKINAIPNKITDNVLMDGLCQEDQLYLSALMDDDSSESEGDDHTNPSRHMSSAWSPMAQSPMMMMNGGKAKRMRRMRPSYAITLSLEDISYIRPSWGLSKGVKRIDVKKKRKKSVGRVVETDKGVKAKPVAKSKRQPKEFGVEHDEEALEGDEEDAENKRRALLTAYHAFLLIVITLVFSLVALSYYVDASRYKRHIAENRIKLEPRARVIEIFRSKGDKLFEDDVHSSAKQRIFRINFAQGIPANLKGEECSCEMFELEARKFNKQLSNADENNKSCYACLDWSMRANLQVRVTREQDAVQSLHSSLLPLDQSLLPTINCYEFKWQSYDTLATPLVDCFQLNNDEQWLGLGDLQTTKWPLNKFHFNQTLLITNLAREFGLATSSNSQILTLDEEQLVGGKIYDFNSKLNRLNLGAYVNFTFFTSSGFFLGDLKSDFQPSIWISQSTKRANTRELCLSVSCNEKCTQTWSREEQLDAWRFSNNLLEYRVCSGANWRDLVSRQVRRHSRDLAAKFARETNKTHESLLANSREVNSLDERSPPIVSRATSTTLEQAGDTTPTVDPLNEVVSVAPTRRQQSIAEGIGLIDRTIFATSPEFMPTLDGQTLRHFVDNIVKLGLKTSPILLVDTRWQMYAGSLKLNSALFPKAKLLFEILRNKGFKIVLTVRPYIDTDMGIGYINSLAESNRLYKAAHQLFRLEIGAAQRTVPKVIDPTDLQLDGDLGNAELPQRRRAYLTRRLAFFKFRNETVWIENKKRSKTPYLHPSKDSSSGYIALIDVTEEKNRNWMIEMIRRSNWLTQEADGIHLGGTHPEGFQWDDHYRDGLKRLIDDLFYKENLYTIPQWTGNFGYMQLAPRARSWNGLQSVLESVLNLNSLGFVLVHPGSVWGDLKQAADNKLADSESEQKPDEQELAARWLQVSIFFPILQFNDLSLIDKYGLHELLQNLVKIRKVHVVPEIKKHLPFTPLVGDAKSRQTLAAAVMSGQQQQQQQSGTLPVIRHVWHGLGESGSETIVGQQFFVGTDILVAPIVHEGQRQRDIYLPTGFWHDELRQTNIRGGKWLRNYPVELNEIAWFTRARRR